MVGASDVIDGAFDADLTIDGYVRITPRAEGFASFPNSAPEATVLTPDWAVGETRDILVDGRLVLGVRPNTPTKAYEVLGVRGDVIHFGARPTHGGIITSADQRPRALLAGASRR